jgi:hypothetical protein
MQDEEILFFFKLSKPDLVPTQPTNQWVPSVLSPGVKRPVRGVDY